MLFTVNIRQYFKQRVQEPLSINNGIFLEAVFVNTISGFPLSGMECKLAMITHITLY